MRSKFYIFTLFLSTSSLCSYAQWGDFDEEETKWEITATAGVNSDGYECDLSIGWYPIPSFGFKLGLGVAGEIDDISGWEYNGWFEDYYLDEYFVPSGPTRFKFIPSISLRSPVFVSSESFGVNLRLFANPGVIMSPGYKGTSHTQWASWMARAGVEFELGQLIIQLGYGASNYNLYSGDPAMENNIGYRNRITHTGFLSIGARF